MSFFASLALICGILVACALLVALLICRMILLRKRSSEFENFCKDAEETVWTEENNPLYKEPVTSFPNPTYCEVSC